MLSRATKSSFATKSKCAKRNEDARFQEMQETRSVRLRDERNRKAASRAREDEETRTRRLTKQRQRQAELRKMESEEAKKRRLKQQQERTAKLRKMESQEAKTRRLRQQRERQSIVRAQQRQLVRSSGLVRKTQTSFQNAFNYGPNNEYQIKTDYESVWRSEVCQYCHAQKWNGEAPSMCCSKSIHNMIKERTSYKSLPQKKEPTGSSVENHELGLVTDRDSMAPNSKVAKSDANVIPHTVSQEAIVFPQSTIAATQKKKRTLTVPNHQVAVMSNLVSMWKVGQFCDSYISNGSTTIMVHKMVLGAVCPKVLPVLDSTSSSSFPTVTFPSSISKEGLLAFAEYMYSGVLDLNQDILVQLKTIAQRLDMKEFELLCTNELHKAKTASILSAVNDRTAPTIAGKVIDIKTELESDDETVPTPNSQQLKIELCSPVRDRYDIQEDVLIDFENIIQTLGLNYRNQSNPASPELIHNTNLRHSEDNQLPKHNRGERGANSSNNARDGGDLQLVPVTSVINHCTIPSDIKVTTSVDNLVSHNSGLVNIPSKMATNTCLSPTTSNSITYPGDLFTADDSKIIPALQEKCA